MRTWMVVLAVGARSAAALRGAVRPRAWRRGPGTALRADSLATQGGRVSAAVVQDKQAATKMPKLELTPPRGTRDFYPEEMRLRTWLFGKWRSIAARYGFEEYDAPVLESEALYVRKAGEEVTQQLYNFEDKGGRRVALRPEMTPSLARMVMAKKSALPLPLKWFSIPQCWRYERTTRGRRREHYQWNMDIWGVESVNAEAELLSAIATFFLDVGLGPKDVGIKVNSRRVLAFVLDRTMKIPAEDPRFASACVLVDKLEKVPPAALHADFATLDVEAEQVDRLHAVLFASSPGGAAPAGSLEALEEALGVDAADPTLAELRELQTLAEAYGFADWLVFDASVVRGLAYYTGIVFEAFDRKGELRAICGGGRYDTLLEKTFGGQATAAVGFGFGDAVIVELLKDKDLLPKRATTESAVDVVAFAFSEHLRGAAAAVAGRLRTAASLNVDLVLDAKKAKWAFKHADRRNAAFAVMLAPDEWAKGLIVVKNLKTSDQATVAPDAAPQWIADQKRQQATSEDA